MSVEKALEAQTMGGEPRSTKTRLVVFLNGALDDFVVLKKSESDTTSTISNTKKEKKKRNHRRSLERLRNVGWWT